MDNVVNLFTQYSAVEVLILLFTLAVVLKFTGELIDYFRNKARAYFKEEEKEESEHLILVNKLTSISDKLDSLGTQISSVENRLEKAENSIRSLENNICSLEKKVHDLNTQSAETEKSLQLVQERLQNQARDRLIELHHKYMYDYKTIDDLGLQSMERTYLYYKAAGGNTFIDTLMDEVRELPRTALEIKITQ